MHGLLPFESTSAMPRGGFLAGLKSEKESMALNLRGEERAVEKVKQDDPSSQEKHYFYEAEPPNHGRILWRARICSLVQSCIPHRAGSFFRFVVTCEGACRTPLSLVGKRPHHEMCDSLATMRLNWWFIHTAKAVVKAQKAGSAVDPETRVLATCPRIRAGQRCHLRGLCYAAPASDFSPSSNFLRFASALSSACFSSGEMDPRSTAVRRVAIALSARESLRGN